MQRAVAEFPTAEDAARFAAAAWMALQDKDDAAARDWKERRDKRNAAAVASSSSSVRADSDTGVPRGSIGGALKRESEVLENNTRSGRPRPDDAVVVDDGGARMRRLRQLSDSKTRLPLGVAPPGEAIQRFAADTAVTIAVNSVTRKLVDTGATVQEDSRETRKQKHCSVCATETYNMCLMRVYWDDFEESKPEKQLKVSNVPVCPQCSQVDFIAKTRALLPSGRQSASVAPNHVDLRHFMGTFIRGSVHTYLLKVHEDLLWWEAWRAVFPTWEGQEAHAVQTAMETSRAIATSE